VNAQAFADYDFAREEGFEGRTECSEGGGVAGQKINEHCEYNFLEPVTKSLTLRKKTKHA
jgi:hypothetical protein